MTLSEHEVARLFVAHAHNTGGALIYICECNGLWHNAVRFLAHKCPRVEQKRWVDDDHMAR